MSSPPTSTAPTSSNAGSNDQDSPVVMNHIIRNLLDNMNSTNQREPSPSTSTSTTNYDIWAIPSTSTQNPIGTNREYNSNSNNNLGSPQRENLRSSPGASPPAPAAICCRCDDRAPSTRCVECNDIFCYECCHRSSSECQIREHSLLPIHHLSPIGARPNSRNTDKDLMLFCNIHGDLLKYYCEPCINFICKECTRWTHRDHKYSPIKGVADMCRVSAIKVIEDTKTGTKAIKSAIDRAVAMCKAYEKETTEASIKIRKAMRSYAQAIEDRERFLLERLERMRQMKMSEISDHMNTLRGILAGLSHTNETLMRSLDLEGLDLFMAKDKGRTQVDYYSSMFKKMHITEERIIFTPPNYELVDILKRQCDIQSVPANAALACASSFYHPRQAMLTMPGYSVQPYPPITYMSVARSLADFCANHTRSTNYYDHSIPSSAVVDSIVARGSGQAIPGYWMPVTLKPPRSKIPGVPMFTFGREGQDNGQVSRPWGLCVDREGNIIVADRRNNRIQIFNSDGQFKTMFGGKGTAAGEFDLPAGITTDTYGRIIVVDKDNHRVQIFTSSGNFILKFGSFGKECGQFQYPWDVSVNTLGNMIVTDTRNHRIQLFTNDGTYITKFVFEGANPTKMLKGPTTPRGVCFTANGNIIVSDFENHRILLVDAHLTKILQCVGHEGSALQELNRPSGIVADDDGRIIVADSKNHRVVVFSSDLTALVAVDLKSPGLDDKDRPSDVALTPEGQLVVLFETLPDTARDAHSHGKQYIKVY